MRVPLPPPSVQRRIVSHLSDAEPRFTAARDGFTALVSELDAYLRARTRDFESITSTRTFVVRFENARQWDMKGGRAAAFAAANRDFLRLGDCSEECTAAVQPWEEPDRRWPVYGVSNRDGVFLSAMKRGHGFKASYKRIARGWFVHNPGRAVVGSLGLVPDVPENAITSPEYQVWRLTSRFITGFMALVLRTDYFLALVSINRVGAVKQRMYYTNLAEILLPDVPMCVQRKFAARRSEVLEKILTSKRTVARRMTEVEEMILGSRSVEVQ